MIKEDDKVIPIQGYLDRLIDRTDALEEEQKAYDFTREEGIGSTSDLWSEEVKAWVDLTTLESLFFTEDWVFIVVDLMANKISSQPLYVMRRSYNNRIESVDYADGHPLNKLIERPNPMQEYHAWMYGVVASYGLLGNAIQWYSKANNWLVNLRTALVDIQFDGKGEIAAYNYFNDDTTIEDKKNRRGAVQYLADSIIHIRRPNPASLLYGLSPFIAGRKSVLFSRYSTDYLNSFYLKQATPGMILEMDKQTNEQQALRQLRTFELAYTGRKNQRRTMILPKGMKASPITHSIADQRLVDLINMNRETVLSLLKVPKHEVGLQTAGSLGSEEYKTALRNFWEATLIPTCRMIEGGLNKFFAKQLGEGFFFKFDLSGVEALKDDLLKKANLAKEMLLGGLSVNEVRAKVWEVEPTLSPQDDMPFVSRPQLGAATSLPPAKPVDDVQQVETNPLLAIEEDKNIHSKRLKELVHSNRAGWIENYTKAITEVVDEKEGKRMLAVTLEMLLTFGEVAEPIIRRNLRETKAAEIPSKTKLRKALNSAFDNFEEEWVDEIIKTLTSSVELGYDTQLDFVFNAKDREKIEALRAGAKGRRREILSERGIESFANISRSHTDRIMATITEGSKRGEGIDQIIRRVADTFRKPEKMRSKAETIARTETLTAVSIGQGAALQDAKRVIPGLKKAWLNADDDRVRDLHLDKSAGGVSGEVVDADEEFSNGLRWPRDVGGPAGEVINCFPTGTLIEAAGVEKVYQRLYRGPMATVNFKGGGHLTATPNHPVLTPEGWIRLGELRKGAKVFKAGGFNTAGLADINIDHVKSSIDQEFRSLLSSPGSAMRYTGASNDFHGDGATQNVNIISAQGGLKPGIKTICAESNINLGFTNPDFTKRPGFSLRTEDQPLSRVRASHASVRASDLAAASIDIHSRPLEQLSFGVVARDVTSAAEPAHYSDASNAKHPRDLICGELLLEVESDEVESVDIRSAWNGHVYNLQTKGGYYIASGYIVHNCRCTLIMLPPPAGQP
jgi:HK97 family phage portal protein